MKMRSAAMFAMIVPCLFVVLSGCGGKGDEEARQEPAEQQNEQQLAKPEGNATTMTNEEEWAAIAGQLGVDLADLVEHESGLQWIVREEGTGEIPAEGQGIKAHYTGYFLDGGKFDSSVDRGQPFGTPIGVGRVIQGWDIAFMDMKVGGKRVLFIPPDLAYGPGGRGSIPPNSTLVFDVELLEIAE